MTYMSSSSSSSNVNNNKKVLAPFGRMLDRGITSSPALFPKVAQSTAPGSPQVIQPPAQKEKAAATAARHENTCQRILQYLASPPSYQDSLRLMSAEQFVV